MRIRPWPIVIIAFVCILAPIFNIVYSASLVNKGYVDYFRIIFEYRPLWEICIWFLLPILVGISILAFNNWSYYLFLGFMAVVLFFTYDQWRMFPERFSFSLMLLAQCLNLIAIGYFLHPSVRMIYFKPQLRWWQQKPRFICDLAAAFADRNGQHDCRIKNVSEGGVLLSTQKTIQSDDIITVKFSIPGCDVQAIGKSVHKGLDGYGIMFQEINSDLKAFKLAMKSLPEKGFKPRVETLPWTSSLKDWFFTLVKTGKGLIPKTDKKS